MFKPPKYLNEWMNELLSKIDKSDPATSQVCAFMAGLAGCDWALVTKIRLSWQTYEINKTNYYNQPKNEETIRPIIELEFE